MNKNLKAAKKNKNDEFYTRLADIENEVKYYKQHFENKIVYCNCDDPEWSNFFIYFRDNFKHLKLKKLISTHYTNNIDIDKAYKLECVEISNENGIPVEKKSFLQGDGDFRSEECIYLLKESDIVCTNPPFSLFREYVEQLIDYNKKFLIIGNMNAITYKEVFKLIKDNKIWLGYNNVKEFKNQNEEIKKFGNIFWFTNLTNKKRNEELLLWKNYKEDIYPKYDNYDAINIDKVDDIPVDYYGYMGVPITFLDKFNPNQFEIIALGNSRDNFTPNKIYKNPKKFCVNGNIENGNVINSVIAMRVNSLPISKTYYENDGILLVAPYARIIIRRKINEN